MTLLFCLYPQGHFGHFRFIININTAQGLPLSLINSPPPLSKTRTPKFITTSTFLPSPTTTTPPPLDNHQHHDHLKTPTTTIQLWWVVSVGRSKKRETSREKEIDEEREYEERERAVGEGGADLI
ncbi:hypothetical protein HanIR_Chr14g0725801 [Helianthus annuus]|nr:hypothetical protein HanIR_Chr14g0725801 [Helianthus annuus]